MPGRPSSYRPSTLKRRDALLEAAIAIAAERGVGAVTHREVAGRAGVPLATTSYFFASIDDLVHAALRSVVSQLVERFDLLIAELRAAEVPPEGVIDRVVPVLLSAPEHHIVAQFQTYQRAAAAPELRPEVARIFAAIERVAAEVLEIAGVAPTRANTRAVIALVDGFQLQRLAQMGSGTIAADLGAGLHALLVALTPGAGPAEG